MAEHNSIGGNTESVLSPAGGDRPNANIHLPLNAGLLTEQCLGNSIFANSLLGEFEKTARERMLAIEEQQRLGNLTRIAEIAHSLAGVAAILAAEPLSQVACHLQRVAEENDEPRTNELITQLRFETNRVLEFIPQVRAMSQQ